MLNSINDFSNTLLNFKGGMTSKERNNNEKLGFQVKEVILTSPLQNQNSENTLENIKNDKFLREFSNKPSKKTIFKVKSIFYDEKNKDDSINLFKKGIFDDIIRFWEKSNEFEI